MGNALEKNNAPTSMTTVKRVSTRTVIKKKEKGKKKGKGESPSRSKSPCGESNTSGKGKGEKDKHKLHCRNYAKGSSTRDPCDYKHAKPSLPT